MKRSPSAPSHQPARKRSATRSVTATFSFSTQTLVLAHSQLTKKSLVQLEAVVDDAFVRIFEFLQTEKLTTVHFFHQMDKDRNGKVDVEEFEGGLQEMGLQLTRVERKLCVAHALSSQPDYMPGLLPICGLS